METLVSPEAFSPFSLNKTGSPQDLFDAPDVGNSPQVWHRPCYWILELARG
jgi:hypothetical protein